MNINRDISDNTKRIAKNTYFLYVRMIVNVILSLITVKYTMEILGIEDYGTYNVIGGVVSSMSFITATISSATQRFLSFEIGQNNTISYNNIFNMLLIVFCVISIIILIILECLAHPIIYDWLQIPSSRLLAAETVYHLSVYSFIIGVLVIPFVSSIISNEKMEVYAYITIADTIAKLVLLAIVFFTPFDRLESYAIGILLITILTNSIYVIYNQRHIKDTRIYFFFERKSFRKMMGYTGWSFFGSITSVMCNQGLSILMNLFYGVSVNAAKAVSDKIMSLMQSFVNNFYMAISPQITKSYAANNLDYTIKLAFNSTRLAYFLMMILSIPMIMLVDVLLKLWLPQTLTEDMITFTKLSLVFALVNVFEAPISFMIRATGNIKKYQVSIGAITLLILPISYIFYRCGYPVYIAFIVEIVMYIVAQFVRLYILKLYYPITIKQYIKDVLLSPIIITIITVFLIFILTQIGINNILSTVIVWGFLLFAIWIIGIKYNEKEMILHYVKKKSRRYIFKRIRES